MTARVRVGERLSIGSTASLAGDVAHHLARVLRLGPGATVEVVDGAGARWRGELCHAPGGGVGHRGEAPMAVLACELLTAPDAAPACELEVWLPLLKGGRTDDLVRQLTELGASRIVPYASRRTVARVEGARATKKRQRWQSIALEATRQCGRTDEPVVVDVSELPTAGPGVFLWEGGGGPARDVLGAAVAGSRLSVLVGPEGGLDASEAAALEVAGWSPASLGPRILRAETAVIAAAVLGLHALGEGGY